MAGSSLASILPGIKDAPFTVIDAAYQLAFKGYLNGVVGSVESTLAGPLLACVTLWIIVQGVLVMRGDIDARRGLTKLISVALVVGLVTSTALYQEYVQSLFEEAIPSFVQKLGGDFNAPTETIPFQLDAIFRLGQAAFQAVAEEIPQRDELDSLAFDGAQFFFFFALWGIFGVYDLVQILTSVLVDLGPLFIVGFLFQATAGITTRWVAQLINYAILLLLTSVVATVVVTTIAAGLTLVLGITFIRGSTAGQLVGLFELDLFIMTGNALVVALPAIAANISGGVAAEGMSMAQSMYRRFANKPNQSIINMGMLQK